jgi:UDP-N-acetylglucosamine 2-epimerase (non-hydrolysing)
MPTAAVVFGTRPEAIKLAPVIEALRNLPAIDTKLIATAQHREMLDQMLGVFDLEPDVDLDLMRPGQSLDEITARVITETGKALDAIKPSLILVQGDTTTVFAASLAAFYRKIPVGHVEAGLRAGDRYSPFPEEINRKLAGTLATLHFAPTRGAADNLLREGVPAESVHVTGNPIVDAVRSILARTREPDFPFLESVKEVGKPGGDEEKKATPVPTSYPPNLPSSDSRVQRKLVLMTAHRRESFGEPLREICRAVKQVAEARADVLFIYPVHPNPNVRKAVAEVFGDEAVQKTRSHEDRRSEDGKSVRTSHPPDLLSSNLLLLPPVDYIHFVHLMKKCWLLLSDSGGVQEEGTALGKPVLVLRDRTERPEAVQSGCARLVGTDRARIVAALNELLDGGPAYEAMAQPRGVFGDGHAGERIAAICAGYLAGPRRVDPAGGNEAPGR